MSDAPAHPAQSGFPALDVSYGFLGFKVPQAVSPWEHAESVVPSSGTAELLAKESP